MDPYLDQDATAIALRLGLALLAGAVIGFDREYKARPAGLRTHALVSVGAALVMLVVIIPSGNDPDAVSRAVQGVITGIGFLGAGVIIKIAEERRIEGLTTAASIWVAAAAGMACGAGLVELVGIAVALVIFVLLGGYWLESRLRKRGILPPDA